MPHTCRQLEAIGVPLRSKAFRGITYLDSTRPVRAAIVPAANALPAVFGGIVNLLAY